MDVPNSIYVESHNIAYAKLRDEHLILEFNPEVWDAIRYATTQHIDNQLHIFIDGKLIASPYIFSPSAFSAQIHVGERAAQSIASQINALPSNKRAVPRDEKLRHLKKWLQNHPDDPYAFSEIIEMYHKDDTKASSKKAITFFNEYKNESVKKHARQYYYTELADCYQEINEPDEAIKLLKNALSSERIDVKWRIAEHVASIYNEQQNSSKAQEYYQKSLSLLDSAEEFYRSDTDLEYENSELSDNVSLARRELKNEIKRLRNQKP